MKELTSADKQDYWSESSNLTRHLQAQGLKKESLSYRQGVLDFCSLFLQEVPCGWIVSCQGRVVVGA